MATSSNIEVTVGSVLGETYEITRLLGEGGMGAVWESNHLRLPGKRFAVKVLHGNASADREAYARFRREAEIASRIGHPNIIEVLDWNTLPSGAPYLVLEYLEGEDLATRLSRGKLALDQALSIVRQIGSALKAAHAADVVHRDLKPGNIYLLPREIDGVITSHVKVLDFGISKIRNSSTVQTQDAVLLGTPQYMAPEQALGKNNEIDGRTDVFALGAILYEVLTGEPPFVGNTLAEVVFKVVYEPVPKISLKLPDVPPEIEAAIERAMAKSAADRFDNVSAFIEALTGRGLATSAARRAITSAQQASVPSTNQRTAFDPLTTGPSSHANGEMAPPPSGEGRNNKWLFLATAIVIGAGGAGVMVKLTQKPPPPVVVAAHDAPLKVTPVDVPKPIVEKPEPLDTTPTAGANPKPVKPIASKPPDVKPETWNPTSVELLAKAQGQYDSGAWEDARNEALRSLQEEKAPSFRSKVAALVTRTWCGQKDLGGANAAFHKVLGGERAGVVRDCKKYGIEVH